MKKLVSFCLVFLPVLFLAGCDGKFEPTESTVFVTSKGQVKSAVMESFDKAQYDFEELKQDVEKAVADYCGEGSNEELVAVDSLTEENGAVTLMMTYQSDEVYEDFNNLLLFSGTVAEAVHAGYEPENLLDAEGQSAELDKAAQAKLKVIVTEESICIQTGGRIKYVSDNVSIFDKKMAKVMEAGKDHPAYIIYK